MKTIITSIAFSIFSLTAVFGQNDVSFNAGENWIGYMNVFNLGGGYEFGSAWDVAELKSSLDASTNTLTLQPNFNTYTVGDEYWVNATTGEGEKNMEAITFVEPGAFFNATDLTFSGAVESNTLAAGFSGKYFIKALNPNNDYQDELGGDGVFDMPASGNFSVTIPGASLTPGLIIQYGFSITGRNSNPDDEEALGRIVIGAGSVGLDDGNSLNADISVYPNPTSDILFVKTDVDLATYSISNLLGQTVLSGDFTSGINVSDLTIGTYVIALNSEEGSKLIKFVKSN